MFLVSLLRQSIQTAIQAYRQSAVIFLCIFTLFILALFTLAACDQKTESPLSQPTIATQTSVAEFAPSQELLVRGVYALDFLNTQNLAQVDALRRDLFEGLTAYDPHGKIIPAMAQSWQTQDNKTWFFQLRDNGKWSNGEAITAAHFVTSWQNLARSNSPLKRYLVYMNVQNAEQVLRGELPAEALKIFAENDRTLRIELDKPTPFLPAMLAHSSLLPRHPDDSKLSNGAYRLSQEARAENSIRLEKNPHYWAQEKVSFKFVDYRKIQPEQDLTGFDVVIQPQSAVKNTQNFARLCSYFYLFNQRHPQLANKFVRQALGQRNGKSLLPTALRQQDNFEPPMLLEELLQRSQIDEHHPLKLRLSYEQSKEKDELAQHFIRTWSASDMVQIDGFPLSKAELLSQYAKADFDLIGTGWCADYNDPSAFLSIFYSQSPDNKTGYHNPQFDKLLEQALQTLDDSQRMQHYQQAEQLLQQDHVAIPMFELNLPVYLNTDSLQGFDLNNPTEVIYSKDLFRTIQP